VRSLFVALAVVAVTAATSPATAADDKAKAMFRYEVGKSALVRGKLDDAIAAFRDAHGVLNTPSTALSLASALEKKGEHAEALTVAKAGTEIPKGPQESFGTVKARADLDKLQKKLEVKVVEATPPQTVVAPPTKPEPDPKPSEPTTDTKPKAEPGEKDESAGRAGGATVTALVGFSAFAFGAGLGLGAFFTSKSKLDDLEPACPDGNCASYAASEYAGARTTQKLAYVGFAVGGAGLVSGIIGAALAASKEGPKEAKLGKPTVSVGLASVELRGVF